MITDEGPGTSISALLNIAIDRDAMISAYFESEDDFREQLYADLARPFLDGIFIDQFNHPEEIADLGEDGDTGRVRMSFGIFRDVDTHGRLLGWSLRMRGRAWETFIGLAEPFQSSLRTMVVESIGGNVAGFLSAHGIGGARE